jgi:hypothetical protein
MVWFTFGTERRADDEERNRLVFPLIHDLHLDVRS